MRKGSKTRKLVVSILEYAVSIGVFVLAWFIYVTVKEVPQYILPRPAEVWKSLVGMFTDGTVYPHLWATAYEVVIGFIIGSILGMALGYLFVKIDVLRTALMPYLIFFQTAPKIALVPLFVVWFGIGIVSKIILIITMVLFPVLSGMMLGLDSIPKEAKDLMKVLKASKWQIFTKIEMQYSLPALFSSFKIGIIQAVNKLAALNGEEELNKRFSDLCFQTLDDEATPVRDAAAEELAKFFIAQKTGKLYPESFLTLKQANSFRKRQSALKVLLYIARQSPPDIKPKVIAEMKAFEKDPCENVVNLSKHYISLIQ